MLNAIVRTAKLQIYNATTLLLIGSENFPHFFNFVWPQMGLFLSAFFGEGCCLEWWLKFYTFFRIKKRIWIAIWSSLTKHSSKNNTKEHKLPADNWSTSISFHQFDLCRHHPIVLCNISLDAQNLQIVKKWNTQTWQLFPNIFAFSRVVLDWRASIKQFCKGKMRASNVVVSLQR